MIAQMVLSGYEWAWLMLSMSILTLVWVAVDPGDWL